MMIVTMSNGRMMSVFDVSTSTSVTEADVVRGCRPNSSVGDGSKIPTGLRRLKVCSPRCVKVRSDLRIGIGGADERQSRRVVLGCVKVKLASCRVGCYVAMVGTASKHGRYEAVQWLSWTMGLCTFYVS